MNYLFGALAIVILAIALQHLYARTRRGRRRPLTVYRLFVLLMIAAVIVLTLVGMVEAIFSISPPPAQTNREGRQAAPR